MGTPFRSVGSPPCPSPCTFVWVTSSSRFWTLCSLLENAQVCSNGRFLALSRTCTPEGHPSTCLFFRHMDTRTRTFICAHVASCTYSAEFLGLCVGGFCDESSSASSGETSGCLFICGPGVSTRVQASESRPLHISLSR